MRDLELLFELYALAAIALFVTVRSFGYWRQLVAKETLSEQYVDIYSILDKAPAGGLDELGYIVPPRVSEKVWAALGEEIHKAERACPNRIPHNTVIVLRIRLPQLRAIPDARKGLSSVMEHFNAVIGLIQSNELTLLIPSEKCSSGLRRDRLLADAAVIVSESFTDLLLDVTTSLRVDVKISCWLNQRDALRVILHRGYMALLNGLNLVVPRKLRNVPSFKRYQWLVEHEQRPVTDHERYGTLIVCGRAPREYVDIHAGTTVEVSRRKYTPLEGNVVSNYRLLLNLLSSTPSA